MYTRANAKWTVNECLRLEREFDLLKLSVQEIALLHDRSPNAIMYKLDAEGLADYNDVFINRQALKVETKKKPLTVETKKVSSKDDSDTELDEDDTSNYEDEESVASSNEAEEVDAEFDSYNIKQQVQMITKQLSNLTAIVYKALSPSGSNASSFR
jgi:hypothetical protein